MIRTVRKGFTLIELLVVVSIISLLVALMVPTVGKARELGRRNNCRTNLGGIGRAAMAYNNDYSSYPAMAEDNSDTYKVGYSTAMSHGVTRAWYLLTSSKTAMQDSSMVKIYCPIGMFTCPSDIQVSTVDYKPQDYTDFKPVAGHTPVSFAFQMTKRNLSSAAKFYMLNLTSNPQLPIAADLNGLCTWTVMTANGAEADRDASVPLAVGNGINSATHGREGQNVLRLAGSVTFETSPLCGVNNDCIWTPANGTQLGADTPKNGVPTNADDSFLMP